MKGDGHEKKKIISITLILVLILTIIPTYTTEKSAANGAGYGYLIDGWGGIHSLAAGAPPTGGPYTPGVDKFRDIEEWLYFPPGGGYAQAAYFVLEGNGTIHSFGATPIILSGPTWGDWDNCPRPRASLQRRRPPGRGWVLDGWGGIHNFGAAPAINGGPYWPGWDIARGITGHFHAPV